MPASAWKGGFSGSEFEFITLDFNFIIRVL